MDNKAKLCKLCNKKLRRFRVSSEYKDRKYHKKCFEYILEDVRNYSTVAYTKYGHKKVFSNGLTLEENKANDNPLIVVFD
tara:strand:- start:179 stop:418 length:240 start_codon:yes stop_codon:yes gene_type:complete